MAKKDDNKKNKGAGSNLEEWNYEKFISDIVDAGKTGTETTVATGSVWAGGAAALAKFFWEEVGKDIAAELGKEGIKAAWDKFILGKDDNSLKGLNKKTIAKLDEIKKNRELYTEYRAKKEALEDSLSGKAPKMWPDAEKKVKSDLKKLESQINQTFEKYPDLKNLFYSNKFNEIQDKLSGEQGATEKLIEEQKKQLLNQSSNQQDASSDPRFQRFSPEQQQVMSDLLKFAGPELQSKKFDFGPIEEEARAGFKQKTIPSIAERFSAMGSGGSQRSSAFPQLLSQAGADLERSLAGMKQNYNLKQQAQLTNLLNLGLAPQYGYGGPLIGGMPQQSSKIDKFAELGGNAFMKLLDNVLTGKGNKGDNDNDGGGNYGGGSNINTSTKSFDEYLDDYFKNKQASGSVSQSGQQLPGNTTFSQDLSNIGTGAYNIGSKAAKSAYDLGEKSFETAQDAWEYLKNKFGRGQE